MNMVDEKRSSAPNDGLFFFAIVYLIIDYWRPQSIIPIGFLRPALVSMLILVVLLIKNGAVWNTGSRQTSLIILFNILIIILVPFASNTMAAYQTVIVMISYVPFILAIIASINTIDRLRRTINILLIIMIYHSIYATLHGGVGAGGYYRDENDLSLYINMWLPFCYFLYFQEQKTKMKVFYALGLVVGMMCIIISFSRGGFVGFVCMGLVAWWYSSRKMVSVVLIAISILMIYFIGGKSYIDEMSTISDTHESTARERILSWEAGWNMFLDNPLGVGGNNFQKRFPQYQPKELKRGMWNRVAHSLWFTLLPELGIIGVILYFSLIWYNLKDIFTVKKMSQGGEGDIAYIHQLSLAFIASLAGFFASATFVSVLYYAHFWYITGLIVVTIRIAKDVLHKRSINLVENTT